MTDMPPAETPADLNQLAGLLGETNVLLRDLVASTTSASDLVEAERKEREADSSANRKLLGRAIGALVALILTVVVVGGAVTWSQIEANKIPCSSRIQSRADIRTMGVRLVDGLAAQNPRATKADLERLHKLSVRITKDALPPPDC